MLRLLLCAIVGLSLFGSNLIAQEFSVYTRVHDLDAKDGSPPIIRSSTLFHAGKVYDLIWAAGEATILEPVHRRIWVVNSQKNLIVSIDFDELKHLLGTVAQRIQELDGLPDESRNQIETLRSQLHPQFEMTFDARLKRLSLTSKTLSYEVSGQLIDQPEAVEAYLNYADWACRLNYVLHPQPVFPTARLELNERLRQKKLMPVEVTLRTKFERPLNFQAKHSLYWNLDARDRESISRCESFLRDPKLQKVSLSEYQRIALSQSTARLQKAENKKQ